MREVSRGTRPVAPNAKMGNELAATGRCRAGPPVILTVKRSQEFAMSYFGDPVKWAA